MPTKKASSKTETKKIARKPKLIKSVIGKASVEKGQKFEDDVANLYRLQGANVTQNVMMAQKKVDILATFSYPVRHRVIVECKDEKKAVNANQRVMEFHGLLETLRRTGEAESAEIITRVPWGDAAKGYALTSGITLLTYAEKISRLIDFSGYLKELISKFDAGDMGRNREPALGKYYTDLSAEININGKIMQFPVIDTYIHEWLKQDDVQNHLAIFGEYGAGKSSFCQKLAHDLAAQYLADPNSSRIPILLNLREFIGKFNIEAYITSFLDRECQVANPKIDLFKAMSQAGIFLLIFDGFDEMAVKVDADTLEANLTEIDKLARIPKNKILLTTRPEYFSSQKEETQAVSPSVLLLSDREAEYKPLKILPWDEKQVEHFLERRVPLVKEATEPWKFYRNQINKIGSLSDLSKRPVLLDMIVKTLPRLIASKATINLPNLYQEYLASEIKRQRVRKGRRFLLKEADRLLLLKRMAVDLYTSTISNINFDSARTLVESNIDSASEEVEAYTRDFLTNSFLVRTGDEYYFSHKSIQDYLLAIHLNEEIQSGVPNIFAEYYNQHVVVDFLKELNPNPDTLWNWINKTKSVGIDVVTSYLASNAATLLCALSPYALQKQDMSGTLLSGANLSGAVLRETDFELANLSQANLSNTDLRGAIFKNTNLTGAVFSGARFLWEDLATAILEDNQFLLFIEDKHANERFINEKESYIDELGNLLSSYFKLAWYSSQTIGMTRSHYISKWETMLDLRNYNQFKRVMEIEVDLQLALYDNEMSKLSRKF